MNAYITLYLIAGACFGATTFPIRHYFSEGPHQAEDASQSPAIGSRIFWIMVCTFLWPLMALTGLNSAWILAKRNRRRQSL